MRLEPKDHDKFRMKGWLLTIVAVLILTACGGGHSSSPRDTSPPAIAIDTPTTAVTYFTASTPISVGGTASDNRTVASVEWSNTATSDTGTATGTTAWSASVALAPGDNSITVTATDGAGNTGTASITITLDTAQPTVTIDTPTTSLTYNSPFTPLTLGGSAWDDVGLLAVYWSNAATGGTGTASGTTTWSTPVDLILGTNPITVWTTDMVGNTATDAIVVTLCLGTALAWGENGSGQLGDGTMTDSSTPVAATGLAGVLDVAAGNLHAVTLLCNGTVWEWGSGNSTPVQVADPSDPTGFLNGVVAIATGSDHTLALLGDGTVRAWGQNNEGQLGNGTTGGGSPTPVQVIDPSDPSGYLTAVMDIDGGGAHSVALLVDGTLRAWGRNADGQLGDGTMSPSLIPVQVIDPSDPTGYLSGVVDVAAHISHSVAAIFDGTVRAWGFNSKGQLGDGTTLTRPTPVQVTDSSDPSGLLMGVVAVDAGQEHSLAVIWDGTVRAWGWNNGGQLGDGTNMDSTQAVQVVDPADPTGDLRGVVAVAAAWQHTLALIGDGTVRAWGGNGAGALGDGTMTDSWTPVQVVDPSDPTGFLTGVVAVAAGGSHSAAAQ